MQNLLQLNFPHPCWFLGSPISSQLSRSIILISTLESRESFSSASAIAPDTSGVDMDVPLFMLYRFPAPGVHAIICRPGATRSGLHTHSNVGPRPDTARFPESISLDPTVMIFCCIQVPSRSPALVPDFLPPQPPPGLHPIISPHPAPVHPARFVCDKSFPQKY